jgi:hypothetical protein
MMRSLAAFAGRRRTLLVSLALAGVVLTALPSNVSAQDPFSKMAVQTANIVRNVVNILGFAFVVIGGLMMLSGHGGVVGPLMQFVVPLLILINADFWVSWLRF